MPIAEFAGNSVPIPVLEYPLPGSLQPLPDPWPADDLPIECKDQAVLNRGLFEKGSLALVR